MRVFSATECHRIPCCFCWHYEEQCLHPYLPYLLYRVCHIQAFLCHRVAQEIWGSLFAELIRLKIPIAFQYLYQMLARADTKALNCPHLCSVFLYFHPTETNTQTLQEKKKKKKNTHGKIATQTKLNIKNGVLFFFFFLFCFRSLSQKSVGCLFGIQGQS